MNQEQILSHLSELLQFVPQYIAREDVFKKHLLFMRYFPDFEWFNIVSILTAYPEARQVKTTDLWTKVLGKHVFVKKGQKGIPVFVPLYQKDEGLKWKIVKVFDIEQMDTSLKPSFTSPMKTFFDEHKQSVVQQVYGSDWQKAMIDDFLCELELDEETEDVRQFLMNCCLFAFADIFFLSGEAIASLDLSYPSDDERAVELYKQIKDIIFNLPSFIEEVVFTEEERIREREQINRVTLNFDRSIHERMESAKKKLNNRNQTKADSTDRTVLEGQVMTSDINENMIPAPRQDQIFRGGDY